MSIQASGREKRWMKLVDIFFVHKYFRTTEELWDDVVNGREEKDYDFLSFFDSIIEHDVFRKMRETGRVVAEDAAKLKHMRESVHGEWSEMVPWVDNSRHASVPRPESSASPFSTEDNAQLDCRRWRFAPGSRLEGNMIMQRPKPPHMLNSMTPKTDSNGASDNESKKIK
jgi:hypothetical protein